MPTAKKAPSAKKASVSKKAPSVKNAPAAKKVSATKTTASPKKKTASKRELIEPTKGDKRFVRRKAEGTFGKTVDVGNSLSADSRRTAKKTVAKGQGDRGDTKR